MRSSAPTLIPIGQRRSSSFTLASSRKPRSQWPLQTADRATKLLKVNDEGLGRLQPDNRDLRGLATPGGEPSQLGGVLVGADHRDGESVPGSTPTGDRHGLCHVWMGNELCGRKGVFIRPSGQAGNWHSLDYGLPPAYREAVQKFMGYARTRGLYTASIKEVVAAVPKHDHYHFRAARQRHRALSSHLRCRSHVRQDPPEAPGCAGSTVPIRSLGYTSL